MSENQPGGIERSAEALGYLDRIARATESQDSRGGRVVDSDFVWSVVAPATPDWPEPSTGDWTVVASNRYWNAAEPAYMLPIDLPNDQKLPYAVIQGGQRSVELVDDITGLVVLAAGPGQIVSGNVGEAASFRAIVGPGVYPARVAVRFSARPISVEGMTGQTSGLIPVLQGFAFPNSAVQAYGWFRNPTGCRYMYIYQRAQVVDASSNINLAIIGPPAGATFPFANGVQVGPVTPGAGEYRGRKNTAYAEQMAGSAFVADPPGREFGFFIQISPGTANISSYDLWYELIY